MPRDMQRSLGDGGMPLLGRLGVCFDAYGEGWAEAEWVPTELACNPAGIVHGGVYGVVHDAAMNFAVNSALESGDRSTTLDVQYQTMRSAQAGDRLRVRGDVVRVARQVAYVRAAVRNADGELVSEATSTCLLRRRDP
ncbi:MAG TPA: PaaI family thioesterase [Acidimicrobiia bacterium]|nr:PaaI family thioesterase [Acidimicrobiia bacterium]